MGETHEFMVRVGTTGDVESRDEAAELLQSALKTGRTHDQINYITVQHSDLDEAEKRSLFRLLSRFDDENINDAIQALDALQEE